MTDTSMVPRKRDGGPPARRPLIDEELAGQLEKIITVLGHGEAGTQEEAAADAG